LLVVVCYPFKGERLMMLVGITAAPGIVLLGSCIELSGSNKILDWLGQISYPIYCVHYPIMHVYNWVTGQPGQPLSIPLAVAEFVTALVLSQLLLLMYDTPIRRILREHVDRRFRPAPA